MHACAHTCVCAGGFTADNPFPCRYSPALSTNSPRSPLAFKAPLPCQSPRPGTGLPVAGMGADTAMQEQEMAHQRHQVLPAPPAAPGALPASQPAPASLQHWAALAQVHAVAH
jgi:hypothetical protein